MDHSLNRVGLQMGVEMLRRSLDQQEQLVVKLIRSADRASGERAGTATRSASSPPAGEGKVDIRV